MTTITIDHQYGLAIIAAMGIGFQCALTPYFTVGGLRRRIFNDKFLQENFGAEHKEATGQETVAKGGYPDQGNGRYAAKLPYKDWYDFNNAQRTHQHYVETVGIVVPATLVAGIGFPRATFALGVSYILGRMLYTIGYVSKRGPNFRLIGGFFNIAFLGIVGLAFTTGWKIFKKLVL